MRLLDNDSMTPEKINEVRDHVEYYVENNDEGNIRTGVFSKAEKNNSFEPLDQWEEGISGVGFSHWSRGSKLLLFLTLLKTPMVSYL